MHLRLKGTLAAAMAAGMIGGVAASAVAAGELNLYSSRHYDTDERLYSDFEERTGITINRIEASADELIERIINEGANSPADILLTVDAGRLWRADQAGLFEPLDNEILNARIPAHLRHPDGHWFAFSQRARFFVYDPERVDPTQIQTYESLADPSLQGLVCTRSSSNIYMLSLMAGLIDHLGPDAAQNWAKGVYDNRARDPQGNDTAQIRAVASGECGVAIVNTYYVARAIRKDVEGLGEEELARISWVFPNQSSFGTHVNVSGAGVLAAAPNKENAIRFMEYLASESAQEYFSAGNDEYPAVPGMGLSPSVAELGLFRQDDINLAILGENQTQAQMIYDAVGYE